ncbi:MAG TPA: rhomboid family intramembrane serine protease [Terriglobia bacterium]|nr:rhomboid family intramembrane serine protease [Terriglobia bacterium]
MEHASFRSQYAFNLHPGRRYYPTIATYVILFLNILIFILMTAAGGSKNIDVLLNFGASYGPYFRTGEYWRLVMPMFLHIGWAHLFVNMFALYVLGSFLEPLYGYGRFTLLYVISGMGGSLLSMEASSHIAAGASGAIFGIAGAMLVTGLVHPETVPRRWKNVFGIGILAVIVINLVFGHFIHHIDNWAHLGGLATGLFLAWLIPPARLPNAQFPAKHSIQPVLALPVVLVAVAMGATANHYLKTQQVLKLVADGARLEAAHQPDRAMKILEEAQRIAPHNLRVHEELGALYLGNKKYAEAIREFEQAVQLNPASPADTLRLAAAYEGNGEFTKARRVLESAQKKMPQDSSTQQALAEVYTRLKLYPEAIRHYQEALKKAPNSAMAHNNLAWLLATCDDPRYRDPENALKHAVRAVQLSGWKQPDFIDTLAAALSANGKLRLAAEVEAKAVQLAPQNREFQENLTRYRKAAGS